VTGIGIRVILAEVTTVVVPVGWVFGKMIEEVEEVIQIGTGGVLLVVPMVGHLGEVALHQVDLNTTREVVHATGVLHIAVRHRMMVLLVEMVRDHLDGGVVDAMMVMVDGQVLLEMETGGAVVAVTRGMVDGEVEEMMEETEEIAEMATGMEEIGNGPVEGADAHTTGVAQDGTGTRGIDVMSIVIMEKGTGRGIQ